MVTISSTGIIEFYGIVYSPSKKVMALTGKCTFSGIGSDKLAQNYLSWNQAKSANEYFIALREASDRVAVTFEHKPEDIVAKRIISFIEDGYLTGSRIPLFVKNRL